MLLNFAEFQHQRKRKRIQTSAASMRSSVLALICVTILSLMQPVSSFSGITTSSHHLKVYSRADVQRTVGSARTAAAVTKSSLKASSNGGEHNSLLSKVYHTYTDYATRLWDETSTEARKRIAKDKTKDTLRRVEHMMSGEEYVELGGKANEEKRQRLLSACRDMLEAIESNEKNVTPVLETATVAASSVAVGEEGAAGTSTTASIASTSIDAPPEKDNSDSKAVSAGGKELLMTDAEKTNEEPVAKKKKKSRRSVSFGAFMGLAVAGWVYSGNYIFTTLFTLMTALGQLEYYRMVMNTGSFPARRISIIGACAMFITALFAPELHQICLPVFACYAMVWFLTMRRKVSTIPEIATTFTGMFYLGYIPSFWVRIRMLGGGMEPTRLAPILGPFLDRISNGAASLPKFVPKSIYLPITTGANFIFWSWLSIAFSDVGAYFIGRKYGKTKLGEVAPAAGAASPNKTVEGALGGCFVSAALATLGAWVQKWPYWYITGPLHGVFLGLFGLIGDLTASIMKRDAGVKDFGDLIPEHGGIMDRVDSYIFTAPYSWLVCAHIIPWLKRVAAAKMAIGV